MRRRVYGDRRTIARWRLPYGVWLLRDNSVILFNRLYEPMARRWPDDRVDLIVPNERFDCQLQFYFYQDGPGGVPCDSAELQWIMQDFVEGEPLQFVVEDPKRPRIVVRRR